jgi:hypothetical protein
MTEMLPKRPVVVAVMAMALSLAGCGDHGRKLYGADTDLVGPTRTATPTPSPREATPQSAAAAPSSPSSPSSTSRRGTSRCDLFTRAEIEKILGLQVAPVVTSSRDGMDVCTWRSTETPKVKSWLKGDPVLEHDEGVVSITRGPIERAASLEARVVEEAKRKKAGGRQELPHLGRGAFAIGASVSGVPIWYAVGLDRDEVVGVQVSGADSRSGVGTVTDFLGRTLARL